MRHPHRQAAVVVRLKWRAQKAWCDMSVINLIKKEAPTPFPEIFPCEGSINAESILNDIVYEINRFIVCEPETAVAAALWIASTWLIESTKIAPIAIISAPEKRCGKSQMLDLFERLVKNPIKADNITPAVLFRIIELYQPTILVDEFDTFLAQDKELVGVFNGGIKPNGQTWRCEGKDNTPAAFSTFSAKAIAGIGLPPDTILDRGIPLRLKRKEVDTKLDYLSDVSDAYWLLIKRKLARLAIEFADTINELQEQARAKMPQTLNDRQRDCWQILIAIASYASPDWLTLAVDAAVKINTVEETMSANVQLLNDIKILLDENQRIVFSSAELTAWLTNDEDLAWSSYNGGKPLKQYQLSKKLAGFEVKAKTVRIDGKTPRGFHACDFEEAFNRYVPQTPKKVQQVQQVQHPSTGAPPIASSMCNTSATLAACATFYVDDFEKAVMAEKVEQRGAR